MNLFFLFNFFAVFIKKYLSFIDNKFKYIFLGIPNYFNFFKKNSILFLIKKLFFFVTLLDQTRIDVEIFKSINIFIPSSSHNCATKKISF